MKDLLSYRGKVVGRGSVFMLPGNEKFQGTGNCEE